MNWGRGGGVNALKRERRSGTKPVRGGRDIRGKLSCRDTHNCTDPISFHCGQDTRAFISVGFRKRRFPPRNVFFNTMGPASTVSPTDQTVDLPMLMIGEIDEKIKVSCKLFRFC